MKKLRINEKYINLLKENDLDAKYDFDYEIDYAATRVLNISKFRFLLHKIVELLDLEDKDILNKEISENNFTNLIISEILILK